MSAKVIPLANFRHSLGYRFQQIFNKYKGSKEKKKPLTAGLIKKHILSYQFASRDNIETVHSTTTPLLPEITEQEILNILASCLKEYEDVLPRNSRGGFIDKENYIKIYLGFQIYGKFKETKDIHEIERLIRCFTTEAQFNEIFSKCKTRFPQVKRQRVRTPSKDGDDDDVDESSNFDFSFDDEEEEKEKEKKKKIVRVQYFTSPVYLSSGLSCSGVFS